MGSTKATQLGRRRFLPEDLSSLVLASLKRDAEAYLSVAVEQAVITVPAYFNDRQRRATRRAGELAGLTVARLLNEPTAAALAYGIHDWEDREPFLVFDLGGGTFDVFIVEIFDRIVEVRASAGDNRLGGEDFNDVVVRLAREALDLPKLPETSGRTARLNVLLRAAAERTRRALSEADEAAFRLVWEDREFSTTVTAKAFKESAEPLVTRLRDPVHYQRLAEADPAAELTAAASYLQARFAQLDPPLGSVLRLRHGAVDLPMDGGPDVLRAASTWDEAPDGRLVVNHGDSFVMLVGWDRAGRVRSRSIQPYGEATKRPASPHYSDQASLFVRHQFKPVWFTSAQLRPHVERVYRPPMP